MGLFRKSRVGEVYDGVVLRCSDPLIVKWPGHYGTRPDGTVDPSITVKWDEAGQVWRYA